MADSGLQITFSELRQRVGHLLGWGTDSSEWTTDQTNRIERAVTSGCRTFYYPSVPDRAGRPSSHQWSFFTPKATLAISDGTTEYSLPDDFGHLLPPLVIQSTSQRYPFIPIRNEGEVRRMVQGTTATGHPRLAAIRPASKNTSEGQRYTLIIYPEPDAGYTLEYRYSVNPAVLSASNEYPYGGPDCSEALTACCLAAAEGMEDDGGDGYWRGEAARLVAAAVDRDRERGPVNLGRMSANEPAEVQDTIYSTHNDVLPDD